MLSIDEFNKVNKSSNAHYIKYVSKYIKTNKTPMTKELFGILNEIPEGKALDKLWSKYCARMNIPVVEEPIPDVEEPVAVEEPVDVEEPIPDVEEPIPDVEEPVPEVPEPVPEVIVPVEKVSDTLKNFTVSVMSKIEEPKPVAVEEPVAVATGTKKKNNKKKNKK